MNLSFHPELASVVRAMPAMTSVEFLRRNFAIWGIGYRPALRRVRRSCAEFFTKWRKDLHSELNNMLGVSLIFTIHKMLEFWLWQEAKSRHFLWRLSSRRHLLNDLTQWRTHPLVTWPGNSWCDYFPREIVILFFYHVTDSSQSRHSMSMRCVIIIDIDIW